MGKCSTVPIKKGRLIQESSYKYLGIIQNSEIKTQAMKDKIRTEYLRRVRKLAKLELYARNMFMGINQWALGVVRYSAGIVCWTGGDLELLDRKARTILTCDDLLHPRANVARLYLIPAKDCVLSECNGL